MIYLDNAATTKLSPQALESMMPYLKNEYGNPSSVYSFSQKTRAEIEEFRLNVANFIGAKSSEIYFTSGGTESDNWAIKGVADSLKSKGNHIITTKIEHHAVLHTCQYLENNGFNVTYLDVDENGKINLEQLKNSITDKTILISVMFANNEIGTIEPIKQIGEIAKSHNIYFHTDAVQAFGSVNIDVNELGIDLMSASSHKINGPKGVGFLYVRKGVKITSLFHGGAQERGRRGSTENVPAIAGFSKAVDLRRENLDNYAKSEIELRDYLINEIEKKIPYAKLNGDRTHRLPNNVNFSFRFIEGESLLIMLDLKGICASSGSACTSGSLDPSHVLLAIGLPHEIAHGSLRLSLSQDTTKEEIDYTVNAVAEIVEKLRNMSPLYEDFIKEN